MKKLIYTLTILLLGCTNNSNVYNKADNLDSITQHDITMQEAEISDEIKKSESAKRFVFKNPDRQVEETLVLKTDNNNYLITPFGHFIIGEKDSIQLETDEIVERAYLYEDKENFYVFFTETDYDGATSWIQKISKKPLKSTYIEQIQGFNLGLPIISMGFAYVNAFGFVGKIDLKTGVYAWKHSNLYDNEKYSFNSFDTVLLKQNTTEFISENYTNKKIEKVVVDNLTGEIVNAIGQSFEETVVDIDGNVYHTVQIGEQIWMVENLKVTHYTNGDPIPIVYVVSKWCNLYTDAYCDYRYDFEYSKTYGRLYNWFAVADSRGLCPIGWHVPSIQEWKKLSLFLGGNEIAGGKMKESGTIHWEAPNIGATNESGFTGLPMSYRSIVNGGFGPIGKAAYWWSSTTLTDGKDTISNNSAWTRYLSYEHGRLGINFGYDKGGGFSVRCIKD